MIKHNPLQERQEQSSETSIRRKSMQICSMLSGEIKTVDNGKQVSNTSVYKMQPDSKSHFEFGGNYFHSLLESGSSQVREERY